MFSRRGARIRRSCPQGTGGQQFLPSSVAGLVLWLRADRGITTATGVSQWNDYSSSGLVFTQATGSKQPTLNSADASYGGQPTLSFASANAQVLISTGNLTLNQPCTMLIVGNMSGASVSQAYIDFNTTELIVYNAGSGTSEFLFAGTTSIGGSIGNNVNPQVIAAIANGASTAVYGNNSKTPLQSGTAGANNGSGTISIGAQKPGNVTFLNGKMAEVLLYNRALSQAELTALFTQYAGRRYKIATS